MIGHPAPRAGGEFEEVIMIEVCDRRDGWVGLSAGPKRLTASLRLVWQTQRERNGARRSECRCVLENVLTPPTLLEMGIFRQSSKRQQLDFQFSKNGTP